jgi:hypothetical protein
MDRTNGRTRGDVLRINSAVQPNNMRASGHIVPHKQAGDMTAPAPQSSTIIQNHIAKRAPSTHDIANEKSRAREPCPALFASRLENFRFCPI